MYGRYISGSPLYRSAFKPGNSPEKFARELAKHYAADLDYALKLIILMRKYKLN
jgi:flagellum-specific peptidoglycan hydrolase FlgJ